ncbi:MAG: ABC transporter permease [Spirochaetales bacterium]|nr:ABC transporter permease [Spirochaetales bacterium]
MTAEKFKDSKVSFGAIFNKYGIVFILIGICILMSILSPAFFSVRNLTNVVRQVSIIGILAMGVTFAIITTGIDLSSGSVLALVGVVVASFSQTQIADGQPVGLIMPIFFSLIIGLGLGGLLGGINGSLHAYGKIPAFIATLGMMTVARGLALLYTAGRPIGYLKESFIFIGGGSFLGIPVPIWVYAIVGVISWLLLSKSKFGRYVFAIGGNMQAARMCGINVEKTLVKVYAYAGLLSAVSGILLVSRTAAGNPTYGLSYELDAIASTVIGGTSLAGGVGSIPLCVVGALIIGVINNGMDLLGVNAYWQQIVKGFIIVLAVLLDSRKQHKK